MKEATKRAASEALAQMLAVTAARVSEEAIQTLTVPRSSGLLRSSHPHFAFTKYGTNLPANG